MPYKVWGLADSLKPLQPCEGESSGDTGELMRNPKFCKSSRYQPEVRDVLGSKWRRWTWRPEALNGQVRPAVYTDRSVRVCLYVVENVPEQLVG